MNMQLLSVDTNTFYALTTSNIKLMTTLREDCGEPCSRPHNCFPAPLMQLILAQRIDLTLCFKMVYKLRDLGRY